MNFDFNIKRLIIGISGLTLLAVLSGWLFQQATASACYSKLSFSYIVSVGIWVIMILPIKKLASFFEIDFNNLKRNILSHIGFGFLIAISNLFLTAYITNVLFQLFFSCIAVDSFLDMMMINNIIPHFMAYWVILAFVIPKKDWQKFINKFNNNPSDSKTEKDLLNIKKNESDVLWIKENNQNIKLLYDHILWVKADNNCILIHTQNRKYLVYQSLKSMEEKLSSHGFARIHRSTLINLKEAKKFIGKPSGDGEVELNDGLRLKLSRNYKNNIKNYLPQLT